MNEHLLQLYGLYWDRMNEAFSSVYHNELQVTKPTSPLLIKVYDEKDFNSADIRLMIFGQETNGWIEEDETMDSLLNGYDRFFNKQECFKYGGQFWNGVNRFISILEEKFPDRKIRYIWNNIVKIGKPEGKGLPPAYIYNIEREFFPVIKDEIKIINPNFLLFLTGPFYDNKIEDNFGKVDHSPINNFSTRQVAKFQIETISAIRTYHPNYLWRNNINKYFNSIINEIN